MDPSDNAARTAAQKEAKAKSRAGRAERLSHSFTVFGLWYDGWLPAAVAVVAVIVGIVTLDITWIVVSLVVGFCAFLGWAFWSNIDK